MAKNGFVAASPLDGDKLRGEGNLSDDLIWGAEAIAQEVGLPVAKVFYHLARKHLPGRKVGGLWVGSRAALRAALRGEEAA
jgi:hypothetical protein